VRTFLLTWNPDRKHHWEDMQEILGNRETDWSCGNRREMPVGSRVFVLRQGSEPKGIVASGFTISPVYSGRHWMPERARRGDTANYVDVRFDAVRGPDPFDVLPRSQLNRGDLNSVHWDTAASGIEILAPAAKALERLWNGSREGDSKRKAELEAFENTLTEVRRYVRKRDRKLRLAALAEARGMCAACRTNYGHFLGGLGARVLQVHHRHQMSASDAPRITGLKDLIVVCANCHALIHADPKYAMAVTTLRRRLALA